ncbi:MAG: hypothetical protein ACRCZW_03330, partial [Lactobacillaceae bacterium]
IGTIIAIVKLNALVSHWAVAADSVNSRIICGNAVVKDVCNSDVTTAPVKSVPKTKLAFFVDIFVPLSNLIGFNYSDGKIANNQQFFFICRLTAVLVRGTDRRELANIVFFAFLFVLHIYCQFV